MRKTTLHTVTILLALLILSSAFPAAAAYADDADTPKRGGVIKVAYASDPHSLDIHKELSTTATDVGRHVYESLYTYSEKYKLEPLLASQYEASADHKTHTLKIRKGVFFHNGKELSAEDVAASFNRWTRVAPLRPEIKLFVEAVETPDQHTVIFKLKEPYADFLHNMTFGVIPKEIAEKYTIKTIPDSEVVGTGPYKFSAREADRFVELVRNDSYTAPPKSPNGRAIHAYLDKLIFSVVPDPTVRLLGMETGQYQYMESANYNDYKRIQEHPDMRAISLKGGFLYFLMNCKEGPTADIALRRAIQAAVNSEPILKAAFNDPKLYTLNGSWMSPETQWYSDAGTQLYNQNAPEKAKGLLKTAGYDGAPITLLTLGEIDYLRNSVIVLEAQLRSIGLNVDLQFVDQGALVPRMMNPTKWQIVYLIGPSMPVPTMMPWTKQTLSLGWWGGEQKNTLAHLLRTQTEPEQRFTAWKEMQALCYDDAARVKIGDASILTVASQNLSGIERTGGIGTRFWNAWLK